MVKCSKRQREKIEGKMFHRCIHPESEQRGEIVPDAVCAACPLVKAKVKMCKDAKKEARNAYYLARKKEQQSADGPEGTLHEAPGFPQCPYRYNNAQGQLLCSITKLPVTPDICNRCEADTRQQTADFGVKGLPKRAKNYFGAIRRWAALGKPTRSPEEVKELFETHCKTCDRYDKQHHACKSCGCKVSTSSEPLGNKLAMASERCPLGRF
jgi:hypothetical protein